MWIEQYSLYKDGLWVFQQPFVGLFLIIYGLHSLKRRIIQETRTGEKDGCLRPFFYCWIGFTVLITFGITWDVCSSFAKDSTILKEKKYIEVEGQVENYGVKNKGMKAEIDTFTVNSVPFYIKEHRSAFSEIKPKTVQSDSIKFVRIWHFKGKILKCWLKR